MKLLLVLLRVSQNIDFSISSNFRNMVIVIQK